MTFTPCTAGQCLNTFYQRREIISSSPPPPHPLPSPPLFSSMNRLRRRSLVISEVVAYRTENSFRGRLRDTGKSSVYHSRRLTCFQSLFSLPDNGRLFRFCRLMITRLFEELELNRPVTSNGYYAGALDRARYAYIRKFELQYSISHSLTCEHHQVQSATFRRLFCCWEYMAAYTRTGLRIVLKETVCPLVTYEKIIYIFPEKIRRKVIIL